MDGAGRLRKPTTTARSTSIGRLLLAARLGKNTGVAAGHELIKARLRDVVILDLLGAAAGRPGQPVICWIHRGAANYHIEKLMIRAWLELGAGLHIFDPGRAARPPARVSQTSRLVVTTWPIPACASNPRRIFATGGERRECAVDHLLPIDWVCAMSRAGRAVARTWLPRRATRMVCEGIGQ